MPNKYRILTLCLLVASGCAPLRHSQELMTLRRVGDSQKEITRYLEGQEKLFSLLLEDVQQDKLKVGVAKSAIIARYGEPVLSWEGGASGEAAQKFLYRHPTHYFSSDKVYLYFDDDNKLARWDYEPYKEGSPEKGSSIIQE